MVDHITRTQMARIWAMAREMQLDKELFYLLVPRGSISALSREEASRLIEYLAGLKGRPRNHDDFFKEASHPPTRSADSNAASREQLNFIHFLFGRIGWIGQPLRIRGFLKKFAGVNSIEEIKNRPRARAIIEALKAISKRRKSTK